MFGNKINKEMVDIITWDTAMSLSIMEGPEIVTVPLAIIEIPDFDANRSYDQIKLRVTD